MNLDQKIQDIKNQIEQQLNRLVPEHRESPQHLLYEAARYSLLGGGKRLRPILAILTTEALGGNVAESFIPACALELIHTYSLIHDDLPCMDDDDFRRGKPSLHKAFEESYAVLTGDFLLTYAFEVLAHAAISLEKKLSLISILSRSAGGEGMIGGQVLDILAEKKSVSLNDLHVIHQKKTGALLTASIEFGGVLAGTNSSNMQILRNFGQKLGLAFQVMDDILDVTSSKQKRGQDHSSDLVNQKNTYVTLMGIDRSRDTIHELLDQALNQLKQLPYNTSLLTDYSQFILSMI